MSQRLHIGKTEESFYDCVVTEITEGLKARIEREWLGFDRPRLLCITGPWKIRIQDFDLWRLVEPMLVELLAAHGLSLQDVSAFYLGDSAHGVGIEALNERIAQENL